MDAATGLGAGRIQPLATFNTAAGVPQARLCEHGATPADARSSFVGRCRTLAGAAAFVSAVIFCPQAAMPMSQTTTTQSVSSVVCRQCGEAGSLLGMPRSVHGSHASCNVLLCMAQKRQSGQHHDGLMLQYNWVADW
jgi:hypothetical protein